MDVLIVTPANGDVRTGNRCTATQWAALLEGLGCRVTVADAFDGQAADLLVALHARHSAEAVTTFRKAQPQGRVVVVLTGTDVYPQPDETALATMERADRLVGLQPRVRGRIPPALHDRLRIVVQSAHPPERTPERDPEHFDVCVVGHLRAVKDPLRAARAARLLPESSRIRVLHAGAILEERFRREVEREQSTNPRYRWLGELEPEAVLELLARSRAAVVSSIHEGGSRVIGEAAAAGTPILAARNDASLSLLGEDYEGLYDAGDTEALAERMERIESDPGFLERLAARVRAVRAQFDPEREREAWRSLLEELV